MILPPLVFPDTSLKPKIKGSNLATGRGRGKMAKNFINLSKFGVLINSSKVVGNCEFRLKRKISVINEMK